MSKELSKCCEKCIRYCVRASSYGEICPCHINTCPQCKLLKSCCDCEEGELLDKVEQCPKHKAKWNFSKEEDWKEKAREIFLLCNCTPYPCEVCEKRIKFIETLLKEREQNSISDYKQRLKEKIKDGNLITHYFEASLVEPRGIRVELQAVIDLIDEE